MRGTNSRFDLIRPVPLVSHGERSVYHRVAVAALKAAGWSGKTFTGPSLNSINAAVAVGSRSHGIPAAANDVGMIIWDDAPLEAAGYL